MHKPSITENNFEAGVGGTGGTVNYQAGYGTPSSPDISQDPSHFQSGKSMDNHSNTAKEVPDTGSLKKDLGTLYSKKDTPTPDDIVTGIKYELGQMIKKDKHAAKQAVLANLKKDPHFYSKLKMLNIDDESMTQNMNENKHPNDGPVIRPKVTSDKEEAKKIFSELAKDRDNRYVVNSGICEAMKQTWKQKEARNSWKSEPKK